MGEAHEHRLTVRRARPERVEALARRFPRIGLDALLAGATGRPSRGRWTAVPAPAAVTGFRWSRRDGRDRDWWPQGIDVRADPDGARTLAISWYARSRPGGPRGARIAFVRLRPGERPRYWSVLLVEAGDSGEPRPVETHAGGLAWVGNRLHIASTFDGIRVFDVRDILDASRPGLLDRRGIGPGGARALLPQREHWVPADGGERMRYSFLAAGREGLIAGEYVRDDPAGRLIELRRPHGADEATVAASLAASVTPGIPRMQGAALVDGRWFVSASTGNAPGDLWVGEPGHLVRHAGVLPPGPEDLAFEPGTRMLWTLSEHPRRRWVLAVDADAWAR